MTPIKEKIGAIYIEIYLEELSQWRMALQLLQIPHHTGRSNEQKLTGLSRDKKTKSKTLSHHVITTRG